MATTSKRVRFIYMTQSEIDAINPTQDMDGAIIAATDQAGYYYCMNGVLRKVSGDVANGGVWIGELYSILNNGQLGATVADLDVSRGIPDGTAVYIVNTWNSPITSDCTLQIKGKGGATSSAYPVYDASTGERFNLGFPVKSGATFIYYNTEGQLNSGRWDVILDKTTTASDVGIVYAECATTSSTPAKVAISADADPLHPLTLYTGNLVSVTFTYEVIPDPSLTLDIDNVGALAIDWVGQPTVLIPAGATALFCYTGINFKLLATDVTQSVVEELQHVGGINWCTYGVTTYSEIIDAWDNQQCCMIVYDSVVYILKYRTLSYYYFVSASVNPPTLYYITCGPNSSWSAVQSISLATAAALAEKYTKPVTGIPVEDLGFTPAVLDNTFTDQMGAAGSVISGARFAQLESIAKLTEFTYTYHTYTGSDFTQKWVNPVTGKMIEDSYPYDYQYISGTGLSISTDLLFTLGSSDYWWSAWTTTGSIPGLNDKQHSAITAAATDDGWVSGNIPLFVECSTGDNYVMLTFRRKDDAPMDSVARSALASQIRVLSRGTARQIAVETSTAGVQVARNNSNLVDEFVGVARNYLDQGASMLVEGSTTILDDPTAAAIDSATLIGLTLRGRPMDDTYEGTGTITANTAKYQWAIDPYYFTNLRYSYDTAPSVVRTAGQLAELLSSWGRVIPIDDKLANVEPGDILFYAGVDSQQDYISPSYKHISDAAICLWKTPFAEAVQDADDPTVIANYGTDLPFVHRILTVLPNVTPAIVILDAEDGRAESARNPNNDRINYNTLCMICRPDLGSLNSATAKANKLSATPLSGGTAGDMMFDDNTLYICVADGEWKQVALSAIQGG